MGDVEKAKNLEQLGDAAQKLYASSFDSYQKAALGFWEQATGAKPFDAESVAKGFQLWAGTVAKDLGTAATIYDKWVQILTDEPVPPGDDT